LRKKTCDIELAASNDIVSFWLDAKAVEYEKVTTKDKTGFAIV
jgi:hypothetical protein